jgi:tetratricopeptide (TPR) repeat protein
VSSKRLTKEDLRHDEFVETTARITNYLQTNFMTVLVVLAGIALAIVVSVFFIQSQKRTAVQADQAFFRVTSRYAQGVYSEVLIEADAVLERFADRDEGKWTLYFAGAAHLALSENDRAIERFDEYLARDAGGQYVLSARMGKALALESRGELEGAVTIYGQLRSETDSEDAIHVQAALAETRALQELGRNDEAVAVLESMLVGASPEVRQEIENRLQTLQALRP